MKLIVAIAMLTLCAAAACPAQTVSGPKSLQLTVYNANFALVKDTRTVTLKKGVNSIEVEDVAGEDRPDERTVQVAHRAELGGDPGAELSV